MSLLYLGLTDINRCLFPCLNEAVLLRYCLRARTGHSRLSASSSFNKFEMEVIEKGLERSKVFWFLARNSGRKVRCTEEPSSKAMSLLSPLIACIPLILLAVAIATRKTVLSVKRRRGSLFKGPQASLRKDKTTRISQPGQVFLMVERVLSCRLACE